MTSYKLATSNGGDLAYILDEFGAQKLFAGNTDCCTVVENCIEAVQAFRVRLYAITWYVHASVRWEVYALQEPGKY